MGLFRYSYMAQVEINGNLESVWEALIRTENYHLWNSFTPRVETSWEIGTNVLLTVRMQPDQKPIQQKEKLRTLTPLKELAWGINWGPFLKAERIQYLTEKGDGTVIEAPDDAEAPFWAATFFGADITTNFDQVTSWEDLTQQLNGLRRSDNLFCAIRVDGVFEQIQWRVACRTEPGTDLVQATNNQAEFQHQNVKGSLVGFWTPEYARTINVPGFHLHLLSEDRRLGGHILDLKAKNLKVSMHLDNNLHLALPETSDFLAADLTGDPAKALAQAENKHH